MEYETEKKKYAKRENRLKSITSELNNLLHDEFPKEADNFEIVYKEIHKRKDSIFGGTSEIPDSQSPAYGIFIRQKSQPRKEHEIMHLFRQDIDKYVKKENICSEYQIPAFQKNIENAIKRKKQKPVSTNYNKSNDKI